VEAAARQVACVFALDHDATGYAALGQSEPGLGAIMAELDWLRLISFTSPYDVRPGR